MLRELLTPSLLNPAERNARSLYIEVFWAGFLTAAASFNAPYALRLGATNADIGLLTSVPALLAILITVPAGRFLSRRSRRMPWIDASLFVHRLGFLLAALLPLLALRHPGAALVWLLIVFAAPAHFFGVGWSSMMADIVPEGNRAQVFAARNILAATAVTVGTLVASRWLEVRSSPGNYQVLYLVGFAASMISVWFVLKLRVPDSAVRPHMEIRAASSGGLRTLVRGTRSALHGHPDFLRMVANTFAHGVGLWLVAPLYILYYVRALGASDGWIGINAMLASLAPVLGFYVWQRVIRRRGENAVLIMAIGVVGLYPVLVGLTPMLWPILVWTALNGLITPGVTLSHFSMLLKICPAEERPQYLGMYTMLMNIGAFTMPLLGVYLAEQFGVRVVLVAGGIICLLGSSLFRFRPLQTPDGHAVRQAELEPTAPPAAAVNRL